MRSRIAPLVPFYGVVRAALGSWALMERANIAEFSGTRSQLHVYRLKLPAALAPGP